MSHEQATKLLRLKWAVTKGKQAWEKLDEHLPRENFSWKILPDAICNEILEKIISPDEVTGDLCHREEFDVAVDLMFLKHFCHEPAVEE